VRNELSRRLAHAEALNGQWATEEKDEAAAVKACHELEAAEEEAAQQALVTGASCKGLRNVARCETAVMFQDCREANAEAIQEAAAVEERRKSKERWICEVLEESLSAGRRYVEHYAESFSKTEEVLRESVKALREDFVSEELQCCVAQS